MKHGADVLMSTDFVSEEHLYQIRTTGGILKRFCTVNDDDVSEFRINDTK